MPTVAGPRRGIGRNIAALLSDIEPALSQVMKEDVCVLEQEIVGDAQLYRIEPELLRMAG